MMDIEIGVFDCDKDMEEKTGLWFEGWMVFVVEDNFEDNDSLEHKGEESDYCHWLELEMGLYAANLKWNVLKPIYYTGWSLKKDIQ